MMHDNLGLLPALLKCCSYSEMSNSDHFTQNLDLASCPLCIFTTKDPNVYNKKIAASVL